MRSTQFCRQISGKLHLRGAGTVGENLQRCDHLRAKPSCTQRTGEHASLQSINRQPGNRQPVNRHPVNRQPANRQPLHRQPVNKQTLLLPLPRLLRSWNLSSNLKVYIPNQSRCESKCRDSNEEARKTYQQRFCVFRGYTPERECLLCERSFTGIVIKQ